MSAFNTSVHKLQFIYSKILPKKALLANILHSKLLRVIIAFHFTIICALFATLAQAESSQESVLFKKSLQNIDQGKWEQAESSLLDLLRLRPYDPVVFNNLAWVHFQQKDFEKGREILLIAMQTNQIYQMVHDNISSMLKYEASSAYNKILNNKANNSLPNLLLLRNMASDTLVKNNEVGLDISIINKKVQKLSSASQIKHEKKLEREIAQAKLQKKQEKATSQVRTTVSKNIPKTKQIEATLQLWAKAWSSGNVDSYLGFYSNDFKPSNMSKAKWSKQRKKRIYPSKKIKVTYDNLLIKFVGASKHTAITTFNQYYKSKNYKSNNKKQLAWQPNEDGEWKITREVSISK